MSRYLTHKQASQYLGINKDSLYKLVRGGEVPAGKRGKALIYDKNRLDKWVDQCHKKRGVTLQEAIKNHLKKGAWL
ncbi:MAG: helix-turn-helix domain-containing protein [bacterium]|nr:helix-turn-helix domain-containing protein [bacterium]